MATNPALLRWTYDEFSRLPDDGNRYEVIAGDLYMTPAPRPIHQRVAFNIGFLIESFLRQHDLGGWVAASPTDVLFAEGDYLEPDLVFVRAERCGIVTDRGIEGVPDLVLEVISESTAARDRGVKRQRYAWFGVPEYWIADVDAGHIEVYRMLEDPNHPQIVRDVLAWRPFPGLPALEIPVQEVLRPSTQPRGNRRPTSNESP